MNVQRVEAILRWTIARPWLMLGAGAILTVAAILSWTRITVSTELRDVFGAASPAAMALADLQEHFHESNPLIVLLERADDRTDLKPVVAAVTDAVQAEAERSNLSAKVGDAGPAEPAEPPFVRDVVLPAAPWYLDDEALEELLRRASPQRLQEQMESVVSLLASPAPAAEAMAHRKLADPLGVGDLLSEALAKDDFTPDTISPDGGAARIPIFLESEEGHEPLVFERLAAAARAAAPEGVQVSLTGAPAIAALSERQTKRDLIRGGAFASVAVALLLAAAYRRIGAVVVVLLPAAASVVWAFGVYAWSGLHLTPLTAAGVAILAGLSVDYAIHAASAVRAAPTADAGAIAKALAPVSVAMACACATTVIACVALAASELRLLHSLAILGAAGLIATLLASLTLAPALAVLTRLATVPVSSRAPHVPPRLAVAAIVFAGAAGVAVAIGAVQGRSLIPFHTSTDVLHPQPNPPLQAEARMDAAFGEGGALIPILVRAPSAASLPQVSAAVAKAVESAGLRGRTFGLHSLAPAGAGQDTEPPARLTSFWEKADVDAAIASLRAAAASAGLSAAATRGAETLLGQVLSPSPSPTVEQLLAAGAPVDRFMAQDDGGWLAVVFFRSPEPLGDRASQEGVLSALRAALAGFPDARPTGFAALGLEARRLVRRDLAWVTALAAGGIALWLLLFLRSWRRTLLVFVPVAYGLLLLLGVFQLAGGALRLDMISIAALPLVIGIGVDDGVFLVSRRDRSAGTGGARWTSWRKDRGEALHAVTTTSLTTAIAFGSLMTSSMPALRTLGLVAALGVAGAWVGAVFVLHPLLQRGRGREESLGDPR